MTAMAKRRMAVGLILAATLALVSCSGNNAPQPGTPAFYFGAAKETYNAGDYQKTIEHLGNVLSSENEYTARALPWMLVMSSGMAQGNMDLADALDRGSKANRGQSNEFRRQATAARGAANSLSLQFADTFAKLQGKDDVTLAFPYPTGSPTEVLLLTKIGNGVMPPAAELETAQKRAIERAVLLGVCRAAGAQDDPGKAQDLLKTGDAKVPRATFVYAMAKALFDESQLYTRDKLDQPDKMKIFCTRAQDALKQVPASKDSADLDKKIQAALKKAKA